MTKPSFIVPKLIQTIAQFVNGLRQNAASFNMDQVMEKLKDSGGRNSTGTGPGASGEVLRHQVPYFRVLESQALFENAEAVNRTQRWKT
jgi:hypothetical protein